MVKLTLQNITTLINREADWTVRLLNKTVPPPEKYIFGYLWFNGKSALWMARLLNQNLEAIFEQSHEEFANAKQTLIEKLSDYLSRDYKITALQSGIDMPPWLLGKKRERRNWLT